MQTPQAAKLIESLEAFASNPHATVADLRYLYTQSALYLAHNFRHFDPRIAVMVTELELRIIRMQETNVTPSLLSFTGGQHGTTS